MSSTLLRPPSRRFTTTAGRLVAAILCLAGARVAAEDLPQASPIAGATDGLRIAAKYSWEWSAETEHVAILRGDCVVEQAETRARADKAVLWRVLDATGGAGREHLAVYLEGNVVFERPGQTESAESLFVEFATRSGITHRIDKQLKQESNTDPLFRRAVERRRATERGRVVPTQLRVPPADAPIEGGPAFEPPVRVQQAPVGLRRVRVFPRSAVPYDVLTFKSDDATPPEQIWVLTGGVNVIIDGVERFGTVDLAADRVVIWTEATEDGQFRAETQQPQDTPFQIYLEGNIVVRQGPNVIRASRAFYDARDRRGLMLNADLRSPLPELGGTVRVRAERLRQLSENAFHAQTAWATTSEFGKPGYRLQSSDIFLENRYVRPWINGRDPLTGEPIVESVPWVTSLDNTILVEDTPLFYSPYVSAPAEDPKIPLKRASAGHDSIFGARVQTAWDLFQITGLEEPPGVEWNLLADGFSERGPGVGTSGAYRGTGLLGVPGPYEGRGLLYYVHDSGRDNLGGFRNSVPFESEHRYFANLHHWHAMPSGVTLFGEIGVLSDRNFLEQYYEGHFDRRDDVETLLYARGLYDNWAWTGLGRVQVNEFTTTTEWLPKFDAYGLSEPLLGGWLSWSQHSSIGYGNLEQGAFPEQDVLQPVFVPLTSPIPGAPASPRGIVADTRGEVLMTRHRLGAPLRLGPLNVRPFVQGEAAHWGGGYDPDDDVNRLVGTAGVDTSLLMWRVFPRVQSRLFNLNGLAHKMRFELDYRATDVSEPLSNVPQYNEFEENSEERARQLFTTTTFGGTLPPQLDPRYYAVRKGVGQPVSAPYHELVDDLQVLRFNWRNRLQTKVGPPHRMRIRDWMRLDAGFSYFPDAEQNFGEDLGLIHGRYDWLISDRTSLVLSNQYDLFENAPEIWNVGVTSQRTRRGSVYLGLRTLQAGALDSQVLTASYNYRMSPKWLSTFSTAHDLELDQSLGQSVSFTRLGRDFVTQFGFNYVDTKDNVGVMFLVQPRFGNYVPGMPMLGALASGPGGSLQ